MHAEAEKTSRHLSVPIQTRNKHWWVPSIWMEPTSTCTAFTPETFLLIEGIYSSGTKPQF